MKQYEEIKGYKEEFRPVWHFFDLKSYLIMAFMMGGGIWLRSSGIVSDVFIAVFYTGLGLALASDYNPGSTPSGDMKFVVSLACIKMRLLPEEAINAATINSAYAMGLSKDYGSIEAGKVANFFITEPIPSVNFIPYAYTSPIISRVFLKGEEVH